MTDTHRPPPHLADEALSAVLDGATGATAEDHLAACARCRDRLVALGEVARAVRAPAGDPGALGERALARALEEFEQVPPETESRAEVVSLARRRRRLPPPAFVGVAAVVLALLAAVPLLLRDGDRSETAARQGADRRQEAESSTFAGGASPGGGMADLGSHDDEDSLVALLQASDAALAPTAAAGADRAEAGDDSTKAAPAETVTPPCTTAANAVAGSDTGRLLSAGSLTWQGRDAVALVYVVEREEGGATRQLFVMSRDGCALLGAKKF